jgi:ferredoxin-NADP reductase
LRDFRTATRLAAAFVAPDRDRWRYLICGPPAMTESVTRSLRDLGVPRRRIAAERFAYD